MKHENNLWWPDSEDHLNHFGLSYQSEINQKLLELIPIQKRHRFLDIGAHVGIFTLRNAEYFEKVEAFEPNPIAYDCLKQNTINYENVALHPYAVGSREGAKVSLDFNTTNTGNTIPHYSTTDDSLYVETNASCVTIDSFNYTDVAAVKIDVEGFELEVLKGMRATIERCKPVIILEAKGMGILKSTPLAPVTYLNSEHGYIISSKVSNDYVMSPPSLLMSHALNSRDSK